MADVKKIATREGYGTALVELGREHDNIVVLDADLAGATKTGTFKKVFPDRHLNFGIAEGNMMSAAAGLAATGMVPFASSFAMFAPCGRRYAGVCQKGQRHVRTQIKQRRKQSRFRRLLIQSYQKLSP